MVNATSRSTWPVNNASPAMRSAPAPCWARVAKATSKTGVSSSTIELHPKRMQLLRELVPAAKRVALLINPTDPLVDESALRDVEKAAIVQQILTFEAATDREIDAAFASLAREKV